MESLNLFKGYGKVNDDLQLQVEDQPPNPKTSNRKPLITTISILSILFLTLTIAFMLGALIHHTNTEPPETSDSADSIKAICNVTRFPDSCFSSLSSSINADFLRQSPIDPESILKLSLQIAVTELSKFSSSLKTMAAKSNGPALSDCTDQMDDALSRLNDSLSAMEVVDGDKVLTDAKISDIQAWISAAVTDQETCLDGLKEMESASVGEVRSEMRRASEYTSNSLAIVAHMRTLLQQFHMALH